MLWLHQSVGYPLRESTPSGVVHQVQGSLIRNGPRSPATSRKWDAEKNLEFSREVVDKSIDLWENAENHDRVGDPNRRVSERL